MSEGELFDALPETPPPAEPRPEKTDVPTGEAPPAEPVAETAETAETTPETEAVPEVVPEPAPRPVSAPRTKLPRDAGGMGATLAALRRQCGMELSDVADATHIKLNYLEALENEALGDLPQTVYVLAYVKKLCELYGVEKSETEELLSGLREQLDYEIPEDINKAVVIREPDEETRRKVRNLTAAIAIALALLLVLLILGGAVLVVRLRGGAGNEAGPDIPASDENRPLSLWEKPELRVSRLP